MTVNQINFLSTSRPTAIVYTGVNTKPWLLAKRLLCWVYTFIR